MPKHYYIEVNKSNSKYCLIDRILYIPIIILALRGVQDVFYAFAFKRYSVAFERFSIFIVYSSALVGIIYILLCQRKIMLENIVLCVIPIGYLILLIIHTNGGYKGDWLTEFAAIISFCLLHKDAKVIVFKWFYWLIQVQNVFSLFMYFCLTFHINIGIERVPYYTGKIWSYYKWGILAVYNGPMDRLCGVFNEPGGLGTVCALLFAVTFKYNKLWEKILLLCTIFFTFSFAGYLLIILFFVIFIVNKNWLNIWVLVPVVLMFLMIPNIDWKNDGLNKVASRFEITENGFAGDNRTSKGFDLLYEDFVESGKFLWGYGTKYSFNVNESVASYKIIIVRMGFISFILIIMAWLIGGIYSSKSDKDCMILMLLFLINIYQRPYPVSNMYGYIVFFGGMEWIHEKNRKTKKNGIVEGMYLRCVIVRKLYSLFMECQQKVLNR